jgi:hypothetical protein
LKDVYTIVQSNGNGKNPDKNYWIKIGVAFDGNKDGSLTVKLNALPINGILNIRDRKQEKKNNS